MPVSTWHPGPSRGLWRNLLALVRRRARREVGKGAEPAPELRAEVIWRLVGRCFRRVVCRAQSASVPQVDVEDLDLLDQEQNRLPGGAHLVADVVEQTLAPRPQSLQLVFVEPVRRRSLLAHRA